MGNADQPTWRLDRRRFLKTGAAGAASLVGAGVLAACGESESGVTSAATSSDAATSATTAGEAQTATTASAPARGGTARITVIPNTTDQLDPAKFIGTSFDSVAAAALYGTLTRLSTSYELSGNLAKDWDSPDGVVWTFRLADDVTFHDGRKLTSADVAYTLKRILDPKTASGGASLIADLKATGIATPDPTTVKLTLDRPNAFLPVSLAWINFGIVPNGTKDFAKGIGSGPFTLVRFETGASAQYARYDSYFKDGRPYLDGLQVVGAADEAAQVQAALSGQADLLHLVPFNQIQQVEASADVEVFELGGGQWPTFAARTTEKPFNDPRVVEALKLAVDREKFSTVAYAGRATPSADVPIPADDVFYPEGLEPRDYDPERAKALLAEAGFRDGLDLELFTRAAGGFLSNATALKSIVEPAGIRIKLNNWPADTYWDKVWLKQPFCTDVWGRTHASYILPVAYGSKGSSNETAYSNPEFDKLVQDAARTTDVEEQKRYFGEAITLLHETSGSITPVHVPVLMAKSKRLQGLVPDWGTRAYLEDAYLA